MQRTLKEEIPNYSFNQDYTLRKTMCLKAVMFIANHMTFFNITF